MPRMIYILLSAACFGSGLTVARLGLTQFSPMAYTGLRLLMALVAFLIPYLFLRDRKLPREGRLWAGALGLGVFGTALPMLGITSALQGLSSGVTAVIATCGPAFGVLFAHLLLPGERITFRRSLGIALALGGAVILALRKETGLQLPTTADSGFRYGLLLGSLVISHLSIVLARRYLRAYRPFEVVFIQILGATIVLLPVGIPQLVASPLHDPLLAGFSVLFGGLVGTFLAFSARFHIIKEYGAADASLVDLVVPIVTVTAGVLFIGERITAAIVFIMPAIILGVLLARSGTAATLATSAAPPGAQP